MLTVKDGVPTTMLADDECETVPSRPSLAVKPTIHIPSGVAGIVYGVSKTAVDVEGVATGAVRLVENTCTADGSVTVTSTLLISALPNGSLTVVDPFRQYPYR